MKIRLTWPLPARVTGIIAVAGITACSVAGCGNAAKLTRSPSPASASQSPATGSFSSAATSQAPAAEPGMTIFICQGNGKAILLQWQDSNGYLSGSYEYSSLNGQAPQEQVSSNSGNLSGTLHGSAISLSIGLQQPLYGTLDGNQLTLNVPQPDGSFQAGTCNSGSLSDWNNAVAALDSQARSDNNTALQQQAQASSAAAQQQAQQEHDQQVSNAQQSLSSDISTLKNDASTLNNDTTLAGDISTMKSDYGTEQSDYQTEQSDGCPTASGDAGTVSGDASTVDGDLSTLHGDIQILQGSSGIAGIQSDIAAVNSDVSALQTLGASPSQDPSGVLSAGNKAISSANAAISWATQQGNAIDGEAHQLATTAQNWASQHGC